MKYVTIFVLRLHAWQKKKQSCHIPSFKLFVPRVRRSTFASSAFLVAGPTVWNSLPDEVWDPAVHFSERFKKDLETHLFIGGAICRSVNALQLLTLSRSTNRHFTYLFTYLLFI